MNHSTSASKLVACPPSMTWPVVMGLLPVLALVLLCAFDVSLGWSGKFTYRYSPWYALRLMNAATIIVPVGMLAGGVLLVADARRAAGHALCAGGLIAACIWIWFAPPNHLFQHVLNFFSPSHDGAFVVEAFTFDDAREYLANFPERAATPPAAMKGTRVISNPPGTTLLAYAVRSVLRNQPWLSEPLDRYLIDAGVDKPLIRAQMAVGIVLAWTLLALTCIGAFILYASAATVLPPASAWTVAILTMTSPAMLLFSPGKDPGQLLTVGLPLLCWLSAVRRNSLSWATAAGAGLGLGLLAGLVHVWVAMVVAAATIFAVGPAERARLLRVSIGAVGGLIAFAIAVRIAGSIDLIAISRAVAAAQSSVTRGPDAMSWSAQTLGAMLFPLFAGVGLPAMLWMAVRSPRGAVAESGAVAKADAAMGGWLIVVSLGVMFVTIGFTNVETPRLWMPFAPLLTLGAALRIHAFRDSSRDVAKRLALLVLVHLVAAAIVWSLMDMREAEMRLISGRILN
ncbi:MAG: hypothetical protein JNG88_05265 [Phycisphaerales bacterium]|nr:hypothetical protein [Phycisphaerales bacterium]